ncbi:hypothetical protein, partial [Oceanobacillus profundus]
PLSLIVWSLSIIREVIKIWNRVAHFLCDQYPKNGSILDYQIQIIAATIPMSNIGVHPSNIKASILFLPLHILIKQTGAFVEISHQLL